MPVSSFPARHTRCSLSTAHNSTLRLSADRILAEQTTAELVTWFSQALRSDAVRQKFAGMGFGAGGRCGADLGSFLKQSYESIGQMVRDTHMKTE